MNGNLFLIKSHPDDPMTPVRVERIETLIDHAASMIEQMLAFALQSNLAPAPLSLPEFIEQFRSHVLQSLSQQDMLILDTGPEELAVRTVYADSKKLQEALMQLLDNAIAATAQSSPPRITIALTPFHADDDFRRRFRNLASRDLIRLSFSDNGCGMDENVRRRIFEPFFTTSEIGSGTGLGLPMVYGYIRQLGGCIEVESAPGSGTSFHLYLPVTQQEAAETRNTITHGHKETILIVDDEHIFRDSCCEVLSELGYLPIAAANGEEGLHLFQQHRNVIRLIICDLMMPGISGIELFRRIRSISSDTPFLFITAYDQTHPHAPELHSDGCEVLEKPFHIPALSQAIESAMHAQRNSN